MSAVKDRYSDIEVDVLDDDGVREVIKNALAQADCTWEALQAQAARGVFTSETAKRAWMVVSAFEEPTI